MGLATPLASGKSLPDLRRGDWLTVKIALRNVTALARQKISLRAGFDPFGNHRQMQRFTHGNDRFGDRHVIDIGRDALNDGLINLERGDR